MKTFLYIVLAIAVMLVPACFSTTPTEPVPDKVPNITPQEMAVDAMDNLVVDLRYYAATYDERTCQSSLPVEQQREWIGLWFAEHYADYLGNSLWSYEYMVCFLYYDAVFRSGPDTYNGSGEYFNGPAWNDFMIAMLVDMIEFNYNIEAYYPIIKPDCN